MNYHGWLLSISLVLLWLFCHTGSGIGSDGTDGRAIVNGSGSESPLVKKVTTAAISVSAATTGSSANTSVSPEAITSSSGTTTSASSSVIERSTVESVGKVYSEDKSTRAFHMRATTELKNDNETVTQAVQSTPPSTTDPSTFPSTSLTASLSIHHSDFATSTKPQQQQQHQHLQQRSKLWAPHSTVADFLKGMDDDAGSNSTENHHISSGNTESSSSSASNSHKTNTNLPNEKLVQQTRSIRSIRLIANNSTSTISIPPLSSQQARAAGRSSRRGNGNTNSNLDGVYHVNNNKFPVISSIRHYRSRKSFSRTHKSTNPNSNLENAAGGRSDIMTSDSGNNLNHGMFTTKSGTYMRTTPTSTIHERGTKKGKTVKTSLSTNNLSFSQEDEDEDDDDKDGETEGEEMKDVDEMPQGDEPPKLVKEAQEQDGATHEGGYYYGRVATRKIFGAKADGNFRSGSSSSSPSDISREHYGKVIDKPMLSQEELSITSDEEPRSGYSSRDDTSAGPHYENPYIIRKDAAIITTSGEIPYSKKEPIKLTATTTGKSGSHRFYSEEDKNATILHRINKTFLSRSKLQPQYDSSSDKHVGSSDVKTKNVGRTIGGSSDLLGSRFPDTNQDIPRFSENHHEQNERENQNASGRNGKGTSIRLPNDSLRGSTNNSPQSFGTSTTGINISRNHWNPSTSPSFFGTSSLGKDKPKDSVNDSDYVIAESGKSHSLLAFPSANEKVADVSPQRKQQRNRTGELNQRQQQKERRKLEGARRPVTTDDLHQDQSGSGSPSEGNDFRQDPNNHRIVEAKRDNLEDQHNMDFNRNTDSQTWNSRQAQMRDQVLANDPSSNRPREHEKPVGGSLPGDSRPNWRKELNEQGESRRTSERKSKSRNSEVNNRKSSDEVNDGDNQVVQEYFPRVESIAGSHSEEGSNDNSYNEYRPPEDTWTDLRPRYNSYELPDDGDSASPLSGTELSSSSQRNKPDIDIVTRFLNIVESQHLLGENCSAGTDFNLGEGVVDRYAQERFRLEAEFAVNRANMLTRMWKYVNSNVLENEYLLHAMVMSMVEFDDDIFAAGNCYDQFQYKNYTLFCPFAYRYDWGTVLVKDLSLEYHYLGNNSEWFFIARKNAEKIIQAYDQFNRGFHQFRFNDTAMTEQIPDIILNVTYEDGKWSKPYFDCGGANIWMITYTVPFFGYDNSSEKYFFKGTSGVDIDLRRVDIDQCPLPDNSTELNIFAGSDKCKNATTMCVPIKGLGFRRGSYRCICKDGFYFPNVSSPHKYYNGTLLEEEYEKKFDSNETSYYDWEGTFECLRCPAGCDTCVDDRPCVVSLNWLMRSAILILQCAIILMLPIVGLFTFKYSEVKVVRAASPVLLRFIVLGAFFIYCTILVMYPSPSVITCTLRVWLREIGFSLAYGALMLKTWRISVIFRVRSAKAIKITDLDLMKRLGIIVAMFTALLVIRTLVAPPAAIVSLTADDLKAWLCKTDWWDHSFTLMELSFLVWGIRLCIVVRKAPSEFNESKFISLAIYNEFLLSLFLNISMLFLQSPANPDLLYIIFFCHVQLTMTLLLCLIFGSKAYMVFRGQGKGSSEESSRKPTSQFISKGRSGQGNKQLSAHNSTGLHSSTTSTGHDPNYNSRLSEDVQEEFRRLYAQLEELKERNMRLGNRHLVAKIAAMQEAADNILQTQAASQINGQSHVLMQQQLHQLSPGNNACGGNSGGSCSAGSSSASTSGHSPSTKGKSPSAFGPLSDISEEENPLQSLSGHVQPFKGRGGPKVLETSIDIVIQSDSSRKTVSESGDNEQETNLNNGSCPPHGSMSDKKAMGKVEDSSNSNNTSFEGITKKDGVTENSSCQLTNTCTSSDSAYNKLEEETTFAPDASTLLKDGVNDKKSPEVSIKEKGSAEPSSASSNLTNQGTPKSIAGVQVQDNIQSASSTSLQPSTATATGKRSPNTGKKQHRNKKSTPSASPSKQQGAGGGESSKGKSEKHHQQPPTCQKSGAPAEEKAVNHKDSGASGSSTGNGSGSSQKIILDLDDKSRFTEEITV